MVRHTGGCHCGAVRFEITAPEDIVASECNCSICSKSGYLGLAVSRSRFTLLDGEDSLITYTFNTGLDPGTIASMTIKPFNGQEWEKHASEFQPLEDD